MALTVVLTALAEVLAVAVAFEPTSLAFEPEVADNSAALEPARGATRTAAALELAAVDLDGMPSIRAALELAGD